MSKQVVTVVICILSILLWYYYTKNSEYPLALYNLREINNKLKTKIKYLESYKNDVSKTFKILDTELVLINEHINDNKNNNLFETSVTPNILSGLLSPDNPSFNNIFNQFLTRDINANEIILPTNIQIESEIKLDSDSDLDSEPDQLEQNEDKVEGNKVECNKVIGALDTNYKQYLI